jgi:hypothetical protein
LLPLRVAGPQTQIALEVQGKPYSRMVLTNIPAPAPGKPPILRYVRLVSPLPSGRPAAAPPWATVGQPAYYNEYGGPAGGRNFPWVLGGDCVRPPTQEVLNGYRRAGYCKDLELQDLVAIYKEEKIVLPDEQGETEKRGLHILEGGDSMATPMPGTAGYMRLFSKRHPPYSPKSSLCRDWAARVGGPSAPSAAGTY